MLERVQSTMSAMKNKLLRDELIQKLLINDSSSAIISAVPEKTPEERKKYITLRPVFEFENKENYDQNTMVNIYTTEIAPVDDTKAVIGVVQINIVCNQDVWELDDDKIRPLCIADRIIQLFDGCKFTVSNKVEFSSLTDLVINKKVFGYALLFTITDGSEENDKF